MHVGLNLLYLLPGVVGGTETYASGLLAGLAELDDATTYTVFVNEESADWPLPASPRFRRVICPVRAAGRIARYRWEQLRFPALLRRRHRVDLLHSLGYVAPLRSPAASVVTIHDLNYRAFGDRMPRSRRIMLRLFVECSARRARRVITVSEFAKREITDALAIPADRVAVTPHGAPAPIFEAPADRRARREVLGLRAPYLVAFSSPTPNKNIPRLLEAYAIARRERGLRHDLVLVGHAPSTDFDAASVRARDGVRVTGYVDGPTLRAIVADADLLAFPSLYEGFGLPVLEAMTAGVPVACSRAASLPEVGGDAVAYFDPESAPEIAATIASLAGDPALRAELARRGRERAAGFTWRRAAERTTCVYREALGVATPGSAVAGSGFAVGGA